MNGEFFVSPDLFSHPILIQDKILIKPTTEPKSVHLELIKKIYYSSLRDVSVNRSLSGSPRLRLSMARSSGKTIVFHAFVTDDLPKAKVLLSVAVSGTG